MTPNIKPMKPPISYYGGKQRMASKIVPLIPQHTVYVEPFCGGCAVLFKKPWPDVTNNDHYREVINDCNTDVVNFFRVLRDHPNELIQKLQLTPYSKYEHTLSSRAKKNNCIESAWGWFVDTQQGFSHRVNSGWKRSKFGRNEAMVWHNKLEQLEAYIDRMIGVNIECDDALMVIKNWDSPQTCFYCDPPYPGADQGHYSGYTLSDLQNLVDTLDKTEGSFLLSNYKQDKLNIPNDWDTFSFPAYSSARPNPSKQTGERTEIVYRRFNKVAPRPEIQALYDSGKFDCFVPRPKNEVI